MFLSHCYVPLLGPMLEQVPEFIFYKLTEIGDTVDIEKFLNLLFF